MMEPLTPTLVGMWNEHFAGAYGEESFTWPQWLLVVSRDAERFGDALAKHASALLWLELA